MHLPGWGFMKEISSETKLQPHTVRVALYTKDTVNFSGRFSEKHMHTLSISLEAGFRQNYRQEHD